ncbi:type II toxin-antitoxin system VapC family toxin [Dyadobacter sp. CY261]|uniref:type II toxin-antitoxin system VapC family toxin n=1 Tax=Dyadobacter sp. CY261 TaxID=2907203 RepID=UPI001F4366F0|nr:type II toxin-antitoxin system VapC family toxin [Dyadobacter sp. CY261]MCF0073280.1 type II toxin-antitoxin system VapC family toxin [Dyadobacter sp. CY261]
MNQAYLWDTNIAVYYLQQQLPPYAEKVLDEIAQSTRICFSIITEIELFGWKTATPFDFDLISLFVDLCLLFEVDKDIRKKAAELRRRHNLELLDAIIVATAIVHGMTLITNNTVDFAAIENLRLLNPFDPQ